MNIKFTSHENVDGVIFYIFEIEDKNKKIKNTIKARYSEMLKLHQDIKQWLGSDANLGKFPKKKIFGNTD